MISARSWPASRPSTASGSEERAGLRNVVAHPYPVIDYGKVHHALAHELGGLEAFANAAAGWLAE